MTHNAENDAAEIARLITASIAGRRWRDMTPLDVASYLVAHDVRVIPPVESCDRDHLIRDCPRLDRVIPPGKTDGGAA